MTTSHKESRGPRRVVIVTGMSGAGKSSTLKALEDTGFETVDNLPVALLNPVVTAGAGPLAIGIDVRTRDFDAAHLSEVIEALRKSTGVPIGIVFLDSDSEVLGQRYAETRRPHPLAEDMPVAVGIDTERRLLAPLREQAEMLIDTSRLSPVELKRMIVGHYGDAEKRQMRVFLMSFGYRNGLPRDADLVFDVRFLKNPHYVPELKPQTGMDSDVAAFIARDPAVDPFIAHVTQLIDPLLPRYEAEGKSYLTIAVGCTGGQHRSVYIVERLKAWLASKDLPFDVRHRDVYGRR